MFRKKIAFILMKTSHDCHLRKTMCPFLYINKKQKNCTKSRRLRKSKTISIAFLYTKIQTLYITRLFVKFLNLTFIYKKHETLRYVTFLYSKSMTFRKKQDNLRYVFIYKKPDTLRYAFFLKNFSNWRMGKHFLHKKQCTLPYIFIF